MPQCPFCKGKIAEDLLRFGGHCPHCLNEIPGEEAATDPGAQARQRQELEARAAAARLQRRTKIIRAVAALTVLLGVGAWAALHEEPEPLLLEDVEIYIAPASAHRNVAAEEAAEAKARAEEEAKRREMAARAAAQASSAQSSGSLADAGPAPSTPSSPSSASGAPESSSDGLPSSMAGLSLSPKGPSLKGISGMVASGDAEIKAMAKTVVDANYKQLRQCYEARLKENPGLSGRWVVAWTIEKDGTVSGAEAEGQGVKDRTFETCVEHNVSNWKFQSVAQPTELARAFVFSN